MQILLLRLALCCGLMALVALPRVHAEPAATAGETLPQTVEPATQSAQSMLAVPPPADALEALVAAPPAEPADLWVRVRKGFRMEEVDSAAVRAQERFYASNPQYMQRVVERSRRYLYFIVNEVEKRGMPTEIALLPIVESAFVPKAQSHAAASGLWQFIPSTGQRYGLERTWWYDGRQDVMAATYAALDYLQDLYNLFGDWQLALAAYNWGEGGVGRALAKTRKRGLEDDFDTIKKPRETEAYVPKLLAVRNIIANPAAFGLSIPSVPDRPYFQPVSTGRHMDLDVVAHLAGITVEEVLHLNPGLIRPVFAHKGDRKLLLPVDKVDVFQQNLQAYDKPLLSWQPYVTKRGEPLDALARRYDIALSELRSVNKLGSAVRASGQTILVPYRDGVDQTPRQDLASLIASASKAVGGGDDSVQAVPARYTVRKGDTLFSIARRFGTTADAIKRANGLKTNRVPVGRTLALQQADKALAAKRTAKAEPAGARQVQYVIRRGDTLDTIARKHDVTVAELQKWNKLGRKTALRAGSKLSIRRDS